MVEALSGAALEDALQFDVTGPVTPVKTLERFFREPDSFRLKVGSEFRAPPIGLKGTDGQGGSEDFEPEGMQVRGNGQRLVGFEQFKQPWKLKGGDDFVDRHESVAPNSRRIEVLTHRP